MSAIVEPTRHRLSIDDFERLVAAGILAEDSRVELIEGDLIDMPPIGPGHASVSVRLTRLLVRRAGDDAKRLHLFREPIPAEGRYAAMRTLEAPFVVEISALPRVSLRSEEIWR